MFSKTEGRFYRQKAEIPYGIVFGFNEVEGDEKQLSKKDLTNLIFTAEDDTLDYNRDLLCGHLQDERLQALSNLVLTLRKVTHKIVTYHNGYSDTKCGFQGHHWHILADMRIHPTADSRWGKEISRLGTATKALYMKALIPNACTALAKYIIKPPRVLIQSTGKYLEITDAAMKENNENGPSTSSPDWSNAKLCEDVNHARITNIMKLMQKYRTPDLGILKQAIISQNMSDWETYIQLMCLPSWDTISKKAQELFKTHDKQLTFQQRFEKPYMEFEQETEKYLSVADSVRILDKWFDWQKINKDEFIGNLRNVLGRYVPKKNTFTLVGEPSSGKSYILRSVLPYYSHYGECHGMEGNYAFMYQGLQDCSLGVLEEAYITQGMVDQTKLILEGTQTMIRVKCKPDAVLQPIPILITSNNDPWCNVSGSRQALMDRMYYFKTWRCPWLEDIKKGIHPNIWKQLFFPDILQQAQPMPDEWDNLEEADIEEAEKVEKDYNKHLEELYDPKPFKKRKAVPTTPEEDAQYIPTTQEYKDMQTQKYKETIDEVVNNSQDLFVPDTPPEKQKKK